MIRIVQGGNPLVLSKIFYAQENEITQGLPIELQVDDLDQIATPIILNNLIGLHLIELNYALSGFDLMLAQWGDSRYVIYVGHWNDGIIQNET